MERAVEKRLMTDQPFGCLLSGGLDSTIVATIASNLLKERGIVLKTFAVGLRGSPDLAAARAVADHLCTKHYEIVFTLDQALSMVEETVRSVESVDITTIRASTAMMLLAQGIKNVAPDIKMVLSGEGADETWMGYLFWHHAPNPTTAHEESVRKLYALHRFDCQRANKSMMRFGLETRVPFLDQDVLDYVMQIDPSYRIPGGPPSRPGGTRSWRASAGVKKSSSRTASGMP
jgi:asparagine synthase (glutamine-hydrolysing)